MFERILVPVDFSEQSRSAFGHGALFARAFGGKLQLCHVVELVAHTNPSFWLVEAELARDLEQQALARAEESLSRLLPSLPVSSPDQVETRVLSGTLPSTLIEHAEEWKAELIVASTHGRTGFSRWLMGSVSERLLRSAPCPVLVARGGTGSALPGMQRVLAAVDLSELSRRALSVAGAVASRFGASLEVLYVWAAPYYGEASQLGPGLFERIRDQARAELDEFVKSTSLPSGLTLTTHIVSGTPTAKINERIRETSPDLLVLGTHGHGGVKRMMLGSVAEVTARYASCATLVVPP